MANNNDNLYEDIQDCMYGNIGYNVRAAATSLVVIFVAALVCKLVQKGILNTTDVNELIDKTKGD